MSNLIRVKALLQLRYKFDRDELKVKECSSTTGLQCSQFIRWSILGAPTWVFRSILRKLANSQQDRLCQWLRSKCSDLMAAVWFMEHPITALASSGEIRSPFRNAVHHMLVRNNNSNSGRVVVQTTDTRRTSTTQEEECMPYDWFGVCPESGNLICPNTVLNLIDELTIILREVPKEVLTLWMSVDVSGHYAVLSHPEATAPVLIYTLMRLLNRFVTHRSVTGIRYSIQLSTERLLLNVFRVLLGYPFNQCGALFPYAFQDSLQAFTKNAVETALLPFLQTQSAVFCYSTCFNNTSDLPQCLMRQLDQQGQALQFLRSVNKALQFILSRPNNATFLPEEPRNGAECQELAFRVHFVALFVACETATHPSSCIMGVDKEQVFVAAASKIRAEAVQAYICNIVKTMTHVDSRSLCEAINYMFQMPVVEQIDDDDWRREDGVYQWILKVLRFCEHLNNPIQISEEWTRMLQLVTPLLKDDDLEYFSKRLRTSINKWSSLDLHTALPVLLAMLERLHSVEKYRAKCLSHMVEAANAFVIAILNITPQNLRVQECLITVCHFVHTVTKLGGASAVNRVLAVPMHQLLQHPVVESLWRTNASTIVQDEMEDLRKRFLPTKQLPPRRGVKRRVQEI